MLPSEARHHHLTPMPRKLEIAVEVLGGRYSLAEVSERWNISVRTINKMVEEVRSELARGKAAADFDWIYEWIV